MTSDDGKEYDRLLSQGTNAPAEEAVRVAAKLFKNCGVKVSLLATETETDSDANSKEEKQTPKSSGNAGKQFGRKKGD